MNTIHHKVLKILHAVGKKTLHGIRLFVGLPLGAREEKTTKKMPAE